ncbi:ABC-type multidrug transport system [Collimonas arenae]|uniref:ABC-type multidrug transport system n=1 Tax=Collimonas arenae TaxID=279058 RepID=A0A0A1FB88_9BURK|nr:ABC transporter permease [Collimonas arenae]AIY41035.1 ABC-type multidrug transport system [Collimonas arenae]
MKKTWVFFKLRMLQLKSDKTALFFCYVLPVILLLGVGYPLQMRDDAKIAVWYSGVAADPASAAAIAYLDQHKLVKLLPYTDAKVPPRAALASNQIKHYLELRDIRPGGDQQHPGIRLYANSLLENRIENAALQGILDDYFRGPPAVAQQQQRQETIAASRNASYLMILLPGVIGMTLLIIGLNGFGAVLIEEEHHGLYKNIKTIDASPLPFLAGLFISRMLIAYSVVFALYMLGVLVFGIPLDVNYGLLLLVITLGSVAFLGLGLALAAISPSVTAFNGIVNFVQMPFIILGGVFFSVSAFPEWLQVVTRLMPLTQLNSAMQQLLFNAVGFGDMSKILPEMAVLAAWSALALFLVRLRFRW